MGSRSAGEGSPSGDPHTGQEGDFVSAGGEGCRVKRGREKDAKNWKKGN